MENKVKKDNLDNKNPDDLFHYKKVITKYYSSPNHGKNPRDKIMENPFNVLQEEHKKILDKVSKIQKNNRDFLFELNISRTSLEYELTKNCSNLKITVWALLLIYFVLNLIIFIGMYTKFNNFVDDSIGQNTTLEKKIDKLSEEIFLLKKSITP